MLAIYVCSGTVTGAIAGAGAGLLGSFFAEPALAVFGTFVGAGAVALGVAGLIGASRPPFQCDRETAKQWVERGPILWPVLNGAALGFGATSRLGFWLWYFIPVGCFLMASPQAGAALWATYGFIRTAGVVGLWLLAVLRPDWTQITLLRQRARADAVTLGLLSSIGLATFVLMGL